MMPQPQQSIGDTYRQQVAGGAFPYVNRTEMIGQVFPTRDNQNGSKWVEGKAQGQEGHAEVTLKLRKAYGGRNPGVKQVKQKIVAYGALGQNLLANIRPGVILRIIGELNVRNFQYGQGPKAGQWGNDVNVTIKDARNGELPFEVLGIMPVFDESPPPRQQYQPQQQQQQPMPGYPPQQTAYGSHAPGYAAPAGYAAPPAPGYAAPAPGYGAPTGYAAPPAPAAGYPPAGMNYPPQQQQQSAYPPQQQAAPAGYANQQAYPPAQPGQQTPGYPPQQQQPAFTVPAPAPAAPGAPTGTFAPPPQGQQVYGAPAPAPGYPPQPQFAPGPVPGAPAQPGNGQGGNQPFNPNDIPF